MALAVRRIKSPDGERHAVLVDESGMPLFYPTLWVTVHLRGNALAVNTIHNALNAIKCIEAWQAHDAIDDSPEVPQSRLTQVHRQAVSTGIPSIAADIRDTRFLDWIAIPASGLA